MSDPTENLLSAFDGHNVDGIRSALAAGADVTRPIRGKLPIYWLLEEYHRTDRLPACLHLLFEHCAVLDDELLRPVLLNDAGGVKRLYDDDPSIIEHRTSLISAFTSLNDVTLLHVAAEYGNLSSVRTLIELGADVNAVAGIDENGVGGHTPLFHTVNSNGNRSEPLMGLLVEAGADCSVRLDAVVWGKGYPWETVFFDVTPISFAQMGLLPQVHRREMDIYANVSYLLKASGRPEPELHNTPNRYLQPK